ncbi:MAG: hypothetical protein HND53_07520 [Proteobacteria bacterium]|nr:DUF3322 and DUF2220 domain-containing protein [Pseudomonadota bacterium]NOG60329.1 hypothetical protein [Pseudomonadota bacterium]
MAKTFLLKPEDLTQRLRQRYKKQNKQWLIGNTNWPISFPLGVPTESQAYEYLNDVQQWQNLWMNWDGEGEIQWVERHWSKLGKQKLPEKIVIDTPIQITRWVGEEQNWIKVTQRYQKLINAWPSLTTILSKYFKVLQEYDELDFDRLFAVLEWLIEHPSSNLYIRQLPIEGIHTKWLINRKSMIAEFIKTITESDDSNFYQIAGLRQEPTMIRIRLLDEQLRDCVSGVGDLSISLDYLKTLILPVEKVYIVENLQTGLAFNDVPGSIVIMGLGYSVDILQEVQLLHDCPIYYWGDIDTDGFAILNRLRNYFPQVQSLLMDESTFLEHEKLWGSDETPKTSTNLPMLTKAEKKLYDDLCNNRWMKNLRLEQEHISWPYALEVLSSL